MSGDHGLHRADAPGRPQQSPTLSARGVLSSSHVDDFCARHLPPIEQQPEFRFDLPELQFPGQLNCVSELLDGWVEQGRGERMALIGSELRWSYGELQAQVNRIANALVKDLGLVPGNRVLLRGANSPMLAACWLAVVKAGGVAVGSMPLLRARELTQIINKAQISHALCDLRLADELRLAAPPCASLRQVLHFHDDAPDGLEARALAQSAQFDAVDTAATDVCMMAFTSGTTGTPKAAVHSHRDVMATCRCWPLHHLRATDEDVFIGSPPLAFTFGLGGLLLFPLSIGAASVLLEKATPDVLPTAIERYRATVCFSSPTAYRAMAAHAKEHDLCSLRKCVSAGETLPAATRALWKQATGIEMIDGIGSTELLHIFISHTDDDAKPGATGKPVPGYTAAILDDQLKPLPPGKVGRLAIKGPTGCRYLADERQTQYVQQGWNLTGDAYLVDEDGWFVYQARTDDMIVSGGYNIAGPEVESVLLQHPAVAECAVIGVPDDERGQVVKAFVVLRPGHAGDAAMVKALQDFVKQSIAPYKYPRQVAFRESLPRTETGKLQRFRLRAEAASTTEAAR